MGQGETILDPPPPWRGGSSMARCQKYKGQARPGASQGKSQLLHQNPAFPRAHGPLAQLLHCQGGV